MRGEDSMLLNRKVFRTVLILSAAFIVTQFISAGQTGRTGACPISPAQPGLMVQALSSLQAEAHAADLNLSPDCSDASPSQSQIWPPNNRMVDISIKGVTDPEGDDVTITIQCIHQDENPAEGGGRKKGRDIDADGIGTSTASVRAERNGSGNGRVYHIDFLAEDSHGNVCGGEVLVSVPHDKSGDALDDGRLYNSVSPTETCTPESSNNAPFITSEPGLEAFKAEAYTYTAEAFDPDQDTLTWSLTTFPDGMIINESTGRISWTPDNDQAGAHDVTVQVDDNNGGSDSQTWSITVTLSNAPPVITSEPPEDASTGNAYNYQVTAEDPDNDPLTFQLTQYPDGMSLNASTGLIAWIPSHDQAGSYEIMVKVDDGNGGSDTQSWNIDVAHSVVEGPSVDFDAFPATVQDGESSTLTWSSMSTDRVHIDYGVGSVSVNGFVDVFPEHTTTYTITVTGAGGSADAKVTVYVTGSPEPFTGGSFAETYEDLVPDDATVDSYEENRFAVVTGSVTTIDECPLSGVSVTVLNYPEYGTALTDGDGSFSLPLEGGGYRTLVYTKDGYLTSHRQVKVPWKDIAVSETIQMIEEDTKSTTVTFDGSPDTIVVHQSTPVSDEYGTRSCTLVFTGDNTA